VNLFDDADLPGGWSPAGHANYSGGSTMVSSGVGSEACFAFDGNAAKIIYNPDSTGEASVFVDGELHSTILYPLGSPEQAEHYVANLPFGSHTIQVIASSGVISVDAFELIDPSVLFLIDRADMAVDFLLPMTSLVSMKIQVPTGRETPVRRAMDQCYVAQHHAPGPQRHHQ
jgi:hypothetical protein